MQKLREAVSHVSRWPLITLLLAQSAPALANQRELARINDEMIRLGVKLKTLTEEYNKPEVLDGLRPFGERMTDAEIMFLLGDFAHASVVFFDLVSEPRNDKEPLYGRAVYYLAESLYQIGNEVSARDFFTRVVERRERVHLKDAVRRLIQIADKAQRWDGLQEHIAVLAAAGPLPPDIAYIQAKSLLRQGQGAGAFATGMSVPREHRLFAKAAYVAAVGAVQAGDFEAARQAFEDLIVLVGDYEDLPTVRDLSAMNRGRLLFEQGKLEESLDSYQFVAKDSPRFDEALYEMTWTYVRAADRAEEPDERRLEFKKAKNTLEVLLMAEADTTLAPEARLLLGNILMRLERHDEATATFDEVVQRYAPVRDEIAALAKLVKDPVQYYEEIATRSREGQGLLPPLAIKWATDTERLQEAMGIVDDLDTSERWIEESRQVVDKLVLVLESERRSDFFPALKQALRAQRALGNSLTALTQRLTAVERELLAPKLAPKLRDELAAVVAERQRLEPAMQELASRRHESNSSSSLRARLAALETAAQRLQYPVSTMQAQLAALRTWIERNASTLSPGRRESYSRLVATTERDLADLFGQQTGLAAEVQETRAGLAAATAAAAPGEQLRARYQATLDRERAILDAGLKDAAMDVLPLLADIEERRLTLANYYAEIGALEARLEEVVVARARDLKAEVLREVALLEAHQADVDHTRQDAKHVIGEVAGHTLFDVRRKFHDIVLRGDVGIVDVAWQLKEEQTHAISRVVNEQRKELMLLDAELQDVGVEQ